ncbi:hypothetical protein PLEOSDRAFT_171872 [Pleurotus ostreatus PC15]|uniref:Uncharacterized protein n=1 Tax=Pleurotus ostreatus (strain PC15) TaxID=1137138 RepID=A0A067NEH0_PLEO1|nr:hypothetical protein PLEOSDRAFT_171872 [Pleurotus ostreatus PC15]
MAFSTLVRLAIVTFVVGSTIVAGSSHLQSRELDAADSTIEFGCEYNQKVNPGKCWRMCDGSTSSKPLWCYSQKKKPITCNNAAACGFDWPCLGPCTATYYPEGPRDCHLKNTSVGLMV